MVIQAFCMSRETAYHAINQLVNRPSNELAPFEALDTEEQLQLTINSISRESKLMATKHLTQTEDETSNNIHSSISLLINPLYLSLEAQQNKNETKTTVKNRN